MFTPHQSSFFAHWLTQSGKLENRVSRVMASARVDMNPHQVEAARFALKSPIEKGVLLADEVGLGKTIEAGLVIAQKWAESKRQILLVVPASLRKQWNQELFDKFELPSVVLDAKVAAQLKKDTGIANPFQQDHAIVICSYEYLARQKANAGLEWNLVVFDEAHKLRNLYKKGANKRAKAIVEAASRAESRILLSATPMQNNLMELYGLSQVIDPHFFGDEKSFKTLYVNKQNNVAALNDLKDRISTLCHRTLRRQVQQEGGINFTNRYSLTQDFTPSPEEWDLYKKLSDYLQNPSNQAISPKARHLVSMGLRKILASSSFAVAETLQGMIRRLQDKQTVTEDSLSDLEDIDDWLDEDIEVDLQPIDKAPSKLQMEIDMLAEYRDLAKSIQVNAKGTALLTVLKKAMDFTELLGGQRKAVVFTESCRTQQYLNDLLQAHGYANRTVILNGSNNDAKSKAIYRQWEEKHQGSSRISGAKTADMKAALVEHFKSEDADILISTEAGGEGINLQFCSVLINYDLPWNPQKIEQRIGRIHRYGQKNDVVVVNFVNRKNPADQRVFQLLSEKLKLFEGVFGASDEVLGAIASNIDIEKRIYQIYQQCRSDIEIEEGFKKLQDELAPLLEVREEATRQTLLNNFDRDVVATLKTTRDQSKDFLQSYEQVLLDLAKAELPEASFETNHFVYEGARYDLNWPLASANDSEFFRLQADEHYLAWELIKKAKARSLSDTHLRFHFSKLQGQYAALKPLIGQSGVLQVVQIEYTYNHDKERPSQLFVLAKTDQGEALSYENAEHLMCIPAAGGSLNEPLSGTLFESKREELVNDQRAVKEVELDGYLEQETEKLERWAKDRRTALMTTVDELDEQIRQFKKETRQLASTKEKIEAKKALRKLERKRDDALGEYHEAKKVIEREEDKLLDEVSEKLQLECKTHILFSARWTLMD